MNSWVKNNKHMNFVHATGDEQVESLQLSTQKSKVP